MTFPIISVDERLSEKRGIKGVIFGKSGIGKTSLLWTLSEDSTLFIDLEAGDLAVEGWKGDTIRPRTWVECRDIACFIAGPNKALREDQPFSQSHYEAVVRAYGDPKQLEKYDTFFIDSITVAGRLCIGWSSTQPQSYSEKTGKPDLRGLYGLHGKEFISWLTHLQHTREKNIWFVGILEERKDDYNQITYQPQLEGSKASLELPGILDQVITMAEVKTKEDLTLGKRYFVTHTLNPYNFPAKDRSGRLQMMEEPHLEKLMQKIKAPLLTSNPTL